jgi:plastocyanin
MNRSRSALAGVAMAIGLAALAGCGSSSNSTSSSSSAATTAAPATTPSTSTSGGAAAPAAGAQALSLAANPEGQLKFTSASLTAKAGSATISFENKSPVEHNLTIASSSGSVVGSTPTFTGGSKTVTVTLKPGTYKYYCTVPGHRQAGMEGILTVH